MNSRIPGQVQAMVHLALFLIVSTFTQATTDNHEQEISFPSSRGDGRGISTVKKGSIIISDQTNPGNTIYEARATFNVGRNNTPKSFESRLRIPLPDNDGKIQVTRCTFAGALSEEGMDFSLKSHPESEEEWKMVGFQLKDAQGTSKNKFSLVYWSIEENGAMFHSGPEASAIKSDRPLALFSAADNHRQQPGIDFGAVISLLALRLSCNTPTETALRDAAKKLKLTTVPDIQNLILDQASIYDSDNRTIISTTQFTLSQLLQSARSTERVYLAPTEETLAEDRYLDFIIDPDHPELIRSMPFAYQNRPVFLQINQMSEDQLFLDLLPYHHSSLASAASSPLNSRDDFFSLHRISGSEATRTVTESDVEDDSTPTSLLTSKLPDMSDSGSNQALSNMLGQLDLIAAMNYLAYKAKNRDTHTTGSDHEAPSAHAIIKANPDSPQWDGSWVSTSSQHLDPAFSFPSAVTERILLRYKRHKDRIHTPLAKLATGGPKSLGAFFLGDNKMHILDYRVISTHEYEATLYRAESDSPEELIEHQRERTASGMLQAERQINVCLSGSHGITVTLRRNSIPVRKRSQGFTWTPDSSLIDPDTLNSLPEQHQFVPGLMAALELLADPLQLNNFPLKTLVTSYQTLRDRGLGWLNMFDETSPFLTDSNRNEKLIPHIRGRLHRSVRKAARAAVHPYTLAPLGAASAIMGGGAFAGGLPYITVSPSNLLTSAVAAGALPAGKFAYNYPKTAGTAVIVMASLFAADKYININRLLADRPSGQLPHDNKTASSPDIGPQIPLTEGPEVIDNNPAPSLQKDTPTDKIIHSVDTVIKKQAT